MISDIIDSSSLRITLYVVAAAPTSTSADPPSTHPREICLAENAAFNPSMSPIASALSSMKMAESPGATFDVQEAVLVEANAVVSQRSAAQAVLASIAPGLELGYVRAELTEA